MNPVDADRVLPGWTPPPTPSRGVLSGRWCRVEPLDARRHAADLYEANALDRDGAMWQYLAYGPFADAAPYRAWVEEKQASTDPLFFAIVDATSDRATGVASYLRIDPAHGVIEVGHLAYSPRLQRTPAATEAMFLLMQHAFGLGYRRYEWKCNASNRKSRAAATRLGFTFEGIFRQHMVYKGRNRDTAWYSILDSEWPRIRDGFTRWLAPTNFTAEGRQRRDLAQCRDDAAAD